MPQFELDRGDATSAARFAELSDFTQAYIEAMFWTECHSDNPELKDATAADLSEDAWADIQKDCASFEAVHWDPVSGACGADASQAGHDFWLTRDHHGVGFWDRPDDYYPGGIQDTLTSAAHSYGPRDLYRGDDGKLYLA